MEERGVSKIVSMRFNHEHDEAEAVAETVADAVRQAVRRRWAQRILCRWHWTPNLLRRGPRLPNGVAIATRQRDFG